MNTQTSCGVTAEQLENFKRICKAHGLRVTPQRVEIFKMVAQSKEHPNAERVFEAVRKTMPNVSLDTVYRTLSSLEELGLVFRVGFSSKARFDADLDEHYHFVCTQCGEVYDVFPAPGERLEVPPEVEEYGRVHKINLQFSGLCSRCQKEAKKDL